jgi:hypothetical protein
VRAARTVSGSQVLASRGPRVRTSSRSTVGDRLAPLRSRTPTLPSRSRSTTVHFGRVGVAGRRQRGLRRRRPELGDRIGYRS